MSQSREEILYDSANELLDKALDDLVENMGDDMVSYLVGSNFNFVIKALMEQNEGDVEGALITWSTMDVKRRLLQNFLFWKATRDIPEEKAPSLNLTENQTSKILSRLKNLLPTHSYSAQEADLILSLVSLVMAELDEDSKYDVH